LEIITEKRNDHIYAYVHGHFSLTQAQIVLTKSLDTLIEKSFSKLLIDISSMDGNISTIQRFLFAEFCAINVYKYREKGLNNLKIAIFGQEPMIDSAKFGETVAINRGANVKVTTDINVALQFLGNTLINTPNFTNLLIKDKILFTE
jgi:hypothetical protein